MQLEHPPFIMTKDSKALVMFIPDHKPTVINKKKLKRALAVRCGYHTMTTANTFMRLLTKAVETATKPSSRAGTAAAEAKATSALKSPGAARNFVASHYEMTKMAYEIRDRYTKECVPGTPDTYIKCCYRPEANGLPVGIYLYTENRLYPDRVFFQTNVKFLTANSFVTVPVFPGSSPMSCVIVIRRSITHLDQRSESKNDSVTVDFLKTADLCAQRANSFTGLADLQAQRPKGVSAHGWKTYNAAFYTELVARGVLSEDKQPPKFHKYEGVAVRSESVCIIDRRWTAGDTVCDVKRQLPSIHDTVSYMWPSTMSSPDLERNVLSVAMGVLNSHMLFPQVVCSVGHRDKEARYLCTAVSKNPVDNTFSGFFVVAATNAEIMKDVVGHRRGMVSFPEELFLVNSLPERYTDPTNLSIFLDGTPTDYYICVNERDHFIEQSARAWPHDKMKEAHAASCVFVSCGGESLYMYIGVFKRGTQNEMFFL